MSDPNTAVPPPMRAIIERRLADEARRRNVRILFAAESGSRAWGFPSPDSDFDARFVYARAPEDYLTVRPRRDVIELPIEGDLDINGWDLQKALDLLLKGNAVLVEWLTSPIVYCETPGFRAALHDLAASFPRRAPSVHHYLWLGCHQRQNRALVGDEIAAKKYFYVLRPAMALRWLRLHPPTALPPMHFPTLVAENDLPREARALIEDLVRRKAETREMGVMRKPEALERLIDDEFAAAAERADIDETPAADRMDAADAFFRRWIGFTATPAA